MLINNVPLRLEYDQTDTGVRNNVRKQVVIRNLRTRGSRIRPSRIRRGSPALQHMGGSIWAGPTPRNTRRCGRSTSPM